MVGIVAVKVRMMPDSPEADLKKIEEQVIASNFDEVPLESVALEEKKIQNFIEEISINGKDKIL